MSQRAELVGLDEFARAELASDPSCPPELLAILADDPSPRVALAASTNPTCPAHLAPAARYSITTYEPGTDDEYCFDVLVRRDGVAVKIDSLFEEECKAGRAERSAPGPEELARLLLAEVADFHVLNVRLIAAAVWGLLPPGLPAAWEAQIPIEVLDPGLAEGARMSYLVEVADDLLPALRSLPELAWGREAGRAGSVEHHELRERIGALPEGGAKRMLRLFNLG
jgi:hypothetical protein